MRSGTQVQVIIQDQPSGLMVYGIRTIRLNIIKWLQALPGIREHLDSLMLEVPQYIGQSFAVGSDRAVQQLCSEIPSALDFGRLAGSCSSS